MAMSTDHDAHPHIPGGLVTALRNARHVTVLTGAGISAESGLATFRDARTGLWSNFSVEDLGTREGFQRNPRLVWNWYAERRVAAEKAQPNPGHYALVEIERHVPQFDLITQNIDGLHRRAGNQNITELHGNIARVKCFNEDTIIEEWDESGDLPPRCPHCRGHLRPDVVWFGEMLPEQNFEHAVEASAYCDLFFSIGTSGLVEPAASLVRVASKMGATVVVINLEVEPHTSQKRYQFNTQAGKFLPRLVAAAWPQSTSLV